MLKIPESMVVCDRRCSYGKIYNLQNLPFEDRLYSKMSHVKMNSKALQQKGEWSPTYSMQLTGSPMVG